MAKPMLTLNGKPVSFEPGQTILEVARQNGVEIPTLCHLKDATPTGACRMCLVQIKGARSLMASCTVPAGDGMEIRTDTPEVMASRKLNLELLLSSGDHNCLLCEANGACKLQALAYEYGVENVRFKGRTTSYPVEDSNPLIIRDFSKCILCGRCVQACNEVQVNRAIGYGYRGAASKIVTAGDMPYDQSDCVFCGQCLEVCPTGALTEKKAKGLARSWETQKTRTTCPYCGVGCQMDLHVKDNRIVKVTAADVGVPNQGRLCVKGRFGYDFVDSPERLTTPLIKENGTFREASWDEALGLVVAKMRKTAAESGPDAMAGLSSARVTNEENYLFQKLYRAGFGTNNVDHCARLCHASTVAGLAITFGSGAMTNSIDEMEDCDVILVIGTNTTENHPVIGTVLRRAVTRNGAKLIVADPRRIGLVRDSALWLRQRPGTDVALVNGLINVIINEGLQNQQFIDERTEGYDEMRQAVAPYTPEAVEGITGVPADDIRAAARLYAKAERAAIFYAMGITQHTSGTDNVKSLANLSMLCGQIGRHATGVNPLRGQNNVQGACDMGALPNVFSGYQPVISAEARDKMQGAWACGPFAEKPGLTVTEIMDAAHHGNVRYLHIMGENPAMSDPDSRHVREALEACEFLVVQDIFLTETAALADVVLPTACWAEKEGTFTNTERRVQLLRRAVDAPGEAKADWQILTELGARLGLGWDYASAEAVLDEINAVTPSYGGITWARLQGGGLQWPCPNTEHPGTPILHTAQFTRGKGLFSAVDHREPAELPDAGFPFTLTTGRLLYHYHTATMTKRSKGVNDLAPSCRVEINPADAEALGLADGDMVRVSSRRGEITAKAEVTAKVSPGLVFIPFHYAEAAANRLTNKALDPVAKIPELKVCAVNLAKAS